MRHIDSNLLRGLALGVLVGGLAPLLAPDVEGFEPGGFRFETATRVPLAPAEAFRAFTEDVGTWWDHTFSGESSNLEIDARPGGAFWEWFDEARTSGLEHARVTWCEPGAKLVMRGPLGFHGMAVDGVYALTFTPDGDGTTVAVDVHGSGEYGPSDGAIVERVWQHFLDEAYRPYAEGLAGSR